MITVARLQGTMAPDWTDLVTAFAALGSLVITAAGLWGVYVQIRKLREAVWGETHGRLCDESLEILKLLAEEPETYDYFYEGKSLEPDHSHRACILYCCEAIANFMEHLVLQRPNLPVRQWKTWERFIHGTYLDSPVIREFLARRRDWYSEDLLALLAAIDQESGSASLTPAAKPPAQHRAGLPSSPATAGCPDRR